MAKVSKRDKRKQKQKQLKAKRNWLINRPSKSCRKSRTKIASNDNKILLYTSHETPKILNFNAKSEQESGERTSSRTSARKLGRCLVNSLRNTASRPVHFFCTCMILCTNTIHKSLDVVNRGKRNVHSAVSGSMANGYSKFKKVIYLCRDM
jgi:hypothetical protein